MTIEQQEAVRPSLAAMNDHRPAGGASQFQLLDEDALLNVARRMVVVVVEADLSPGQKSGMLREAVQLCRRCGWVASLAS